MNLRKNAGAFIRQFFGQREKDVALAVIAAAAARAVMVCGTFISVPLALKALGVERFGIWMTINATAGLFVVTDMGVGNGLLNAVAYASARRDKAGAASAVTTASVVLLLMALLVLGLFGLIFPAIRWETVLRASSVLARKEAAPAVAAFVICTAVGIPLAVVQRVRLAFQEGYVNGVWEAIGGAVSILALVIVLSMNYSLPYVIVVASGIPLVATACNGYALFRIRRPWLLAGLANVKRSALAAMVKTGMQFLLLQLAVTVIMATDNILITYVIGPDAVADYAVITRLYSVPAMLLNLMLAPLWPAYSVAFGKGDMAWIKMTLRRCTILGVIMTGATAILLFILGARVTDIWVGKGHAPSQDLLLGLGISMLTMSIVSNLSTCLNALDQVKSQVRVFWVGSLVGFALKLFLIRKMGVVGIVCAAGVCNVFMLCIPLAWLSITALRSDKFIGPAEDHFIR